MISKEVEVVNEYGLHARAAAKLVNVANKFTSKITLEKEGMVADAKSILGILMLAASKGSKIKIMCDGEDEKEALEAVENLFNQGFS